MNFGAITAALAAALLWKKEPITELPSGKALLLAIALGVTPFLILYAVLYL